MKGKKLLAGVLSAAMVLGTMAFPAFAEENPGTDPVKEFMNLKAQSVNDTHEIDLKGATVDVTGEYWSNIYADITIKNGTINFSDFTTPDGIFRVGYDNDTPVTLTLEDMNINVTNAQLGTGVFNINSASKISITNSNITVNCTQEDDIVGVFYAGSGLCGDINIQNSAINTEKANAVFYRVNVNVEDSTISVTDNYKPVFRGAEGVVEDTTVTVVGQLGSDNRALIQALDSNSLEFVGNTTITTDASTPFVTSGDEANITVSAASTVTLPASAADVVKIYTVLKDGTYYLTFADALAAAEDGDTITLLNDATLTTDYPGSKELTIDLNDNTLTMGDKKMLLSADTTIKNGKIKVELSSDNWDGIIWTWGASDIDILLEDVVIDSYSENTLLYIFDFVHTSNLALTLKDSTINVGGNTQIVFCDNAFGNGNTTTLINTTVNADGEQVVFLYGDNFVTDGSEINAPDGTLLQGYAYSNLTINNSTVVADNTKAGTGELKIENDSDVLITGKVGVYEEGLEPPTGVNITVEDDSVLYTPVVSENVTGNGLADALIDRADKITVEFKQVEGNANEYNIVLNAENETIYEFIGAELQFVNGSKTLSNADMLYTIEAADDINVVEAGDGQFGFYIKDGATTNRITAHKIILGKVVFGQQGNIDFSIKQDGNNSVQTTQYRTHLEEEYKPNVVDGLELVINSEKSSINSTVKAATRNVVVNVDFAHTLDNTGWNGDHQITVTLKDAFGDIIGEAEANPLAIANNAGTYTFPKVPVGRITVTLKAPGFRTYTYTTTFEEGANEDDALVLNFWNDTKRDTEKAVEIGGRAMPNNFVVGDIVMDYTVDKYDLAAVTSYYGTYNLTDEKKIRYDLNRDGSIDITDVAYVLHNFGF